MESRNPRGYFLANMKRYGNLWRQVCCRENIELAFAKAFKGKKKEGALLDVYEHQDEYIRKALTLFADPMNLNQSVLRIKLVFKPKLRIIYAAPFWPDRVVHHAVMNVLEPIYESVFSDASYSCRKGRGQHNASRLCMLYAKRYKYVWQFDCSQFYVNLDHDLMSDLYRWKVKDPQMLLWQEKQVRTVATRQKNIEILKDLITRRIAEDQARVQLAKLERSSVIFDNAKAGVPIGNLCSQWDGNLYLTHFDNWVHQVLKASAYIRFCDDGLIFADDKAFLHDCAEMAEDYLFRERRVLLSRSTVYPTNNGIDFCGYRHFHNGKLLVRKGTATNIKRRMRSLMAKVDNGLITTEKARSVVGSDWGILRHAKTFNFRKSLSIDSIRDELAWRIQQQHEEI